MGVRAVEPVEPRRASRHLAAVMGDDAIEWRVERRLAPYVETIAAMETRAAAIRAGDARELVWLLEHPPLYTAGTSAASAELIDPSRLPVFETGRGGRYTYHGPGQRVGYLMLDLDRRGRDVRRFVAALEAWLIAALRRLGVAAHTAEGRIGVWTNGPDGREAKIGAIGVRVRRWVTLHGFAINVSPDLAHFEGIVPCGLPDHPVTSLEALGTSGSLEGFDDALGEEFDAFLSGLSGVRRPLE